MTNLAVQARGLRKSYGDQLVLDGIDLSVTRGSVLALIGPNGSGKTTTVWILSTILPADGGTAVVAGHDVTREPGRVRRAIGVTGQFSAVDNMLTGRENLLLMADLSHLSRRDGQRRAGELLDRFDLAEAAGKPALTYSGGMRRRLDLAMTLVSEPEIIFLDEPSSGLDPRSRRTMREIVRELSGSGVTIFLTTQYLEEADELADRIAVLDRGKLVAEGTPAELKRAVPGGHVELHLPDPESFAAAAGLLATRNPTTDKEAMAMRVPVDGSLGAVRSLLDQLDVHSVPVDSVSVRTADLDDVFLALTARTGLSETAAQEAAR
jgi:ABC-2 type transport system ATP-binding protein